MKAKWDIENTHRLNITDVPLRLTIPSARNSAEVHAALSEMPLASLVSRQLTAEIDYSSIHPVEAAEKFVKLRHKAPLTQDCCAN